MSQTTESDFAGDPPAAPEEASELRQHIPKQASLLPTVAILAALVPTLFALVALIALVQDDDGGSGADTAQGGEGGGDGEAALTFIATEFAFDPVEASALQEVSITLDNQGAIEHNLNILQAGTVISSEDEYSDDLSIGVIDVAAGETASRDFTLEPGNYQIICSIAGHLASGMAGQIVVS